MKNSPTLHLLSKLNGTFLKNQLTGLEKRFNDLPGKTRKIIAVATGLFVAMTCTQIIIGALMFSTSSVDLPATITSTRLQNKTEGQSSSETMVPIGRLENINDESSYRIVAIDTHGEYFISQSQPTPQNQSLIWTAITTESLRVIEQQSRFIPVSQDTTINP